MDQATYCEIASRKVGGLCPCQSILYTKIFNLDNNNINDELLFTIKYTNGYVCKDIHDFIDTWILSSVSEFINEDGNGCKSIKMYLKRNPLFVLHIMFCKKRKYTIFVYKTINEGVYNNTTMNVYDIDGQTPS